MKLYLMKNIFEKAAKNLIPLHAFIEITRKCNLRCLHCYCDTNQQEMEIALFEKILYELKQNETIFVTFSGGEPFYNSIFPEMLEKIKKFPFILNIFTNATLIDKTMATLLSKLNIYKIAVSLYDINSEVHDFFTQTKNSFKKALQGIKLLLAKGIRVQLKFILTKYCKSSLKELIEFSKKLNAIPYLTPILIPRDSGDITPCSFMMSAENLKLYYTHYILSNFSNFSCQLESYSKMKSCNGGKNFLCIAPYGEIYPCVQYRKAAGNIKDSSLKDIWMRSELLNQFRNSFEIPEDCYNCSLKNICFMCPGLAQLVKPDNKLNYPCYITKILSEVINEKLSKFN